MKCYNHPYVNATSICTVCGRGICNECVSSKPGLCKSCYNNHLRGKVKSAVLSLIIIAVIGIIGYLWDPIGKDGMSQSGLSSYMLMATCTGIFLISGRIRIPAIAFLATGANNVGFMMLLVFGKPRLG